MLRTRAPSPTADGRLSSRTQPRRSTPAQPRLVKIDAEAVDLTLFSTASGGRFSSPADDSYRAGFLPPPRLPGFPTQPPGLVPPSPRVFLFQTNARQAPRFAWRGAVIPARSSAARLTHPHLTSRTSTTGVLCQNGFLLMRRGRVRASWRALLGGTARVADTSAGAGARLLRERFTLELSPKTKSDFSC